MESLPLTAASFQQFLGQGRLMGSRCAPCGEISLPPRGICPRCRSAAAEWVELAGRGKLAAFTCISVPPTGLAEQGYGRDRPYCVGIVELEGGQRISARIQGVDAAHPESIRIGLALALAAGVQSGQALLAFRPVA